MTTDGTDITVTAATGARPTVADDTISLAYVGRSSWTVDTLAGGGNSGFSLSHALDAPFDSAFCPAYDPVLTVVKSIASIADTNGNGLVGDVGDTITYDIEVTNDGNTSIADITITDTLLGLTDAAVTPDDLAPGESTSLTGQTYLITLANSDAQEVENSASATGTPVETDADGDPVPSAPLLDTSYTQLPDVSDDSDTGTEPDLNASDQPVDVVSPGTTDTNGVGGDDGDEPTVLNLPRWPAPVPTNALAPAQCVASDNWDEVIFAAGGTGTARNISVATTGFTDVTWPASTAGATIFSGPAHTRGDTTSNQVSFFINRPPLDTSPSTPVGHTPFSSTFTQTFSGDADIFEVRLHWRSIDQIGWAFDPALNPGVAFEFLSGADDVGNAGNSDKPLVC